MDEEAKEEEAKEDGAPVIQNNNLNLEGVDETET